MACNCISDGSDEDRENSKANPPFAMPGPEAMKEQLCDVCILWCQLHMGSNIAAGGDDQAFWKAQLNLQKWQEENMELQVQTGCCDSADPQMSVQTCTRVHGVQQGGYKTRMHVCCDE